jgi:hypothetical protein
MFVIFYQNRTFFSPGGSRQPKWGKLKHFLFRICLGALQIMWSGNWRGACIWRLLPFDKSNFNYGSSCICSKCRTWLSVVWKTFESVWTVIQMWNENSFHLFYSFVRVDGDAFFQQKWIPYANRVSMLNQVSMKKHLSQCGRWCGEGSPWECMCMLFRY